MKLNKLGARYNLLTGPVMIASQDLYTSDSVKNHPIGTLAFGALGKMFRYALIGTSALIKGNVLQGAVNDAQFDALAVQTAGVIGDQSIKLTNGTTTIVPFMFQDGSVMCNTAGAAVAVGDEYSVVGDIKGTLTTGGTVQIFLDRPLRYAYATSATKVGLQKSPWGGVIQFPTTQTGVVAGVAIFEVAASTATVPQYGWVQTHGLASVLSDNSTFAIGSNVSSKGNSGTAGCCSVEVAGTQQQRIGYAMHASETTKCIPVFLQID